MRTPDTQTHHGTNSVTRRPRYLAGPQSISKSSHLAQRLMYLRYHVDPINLNNRISRSPQRRM